MKSINLFWLVILASLFFASCEKEPIKEPIVKTTGVKSIEGNSIKKPGDYGPSGVFYVRGHKYMMIAFDWVHVGYYMREWRTSGFFATLFGDDCYGTHGGCLPDVEVSGTTSIVDDPNFNKDDIISVTLDDKVARLTNKNYSIPLKTAVSSGQDDIVKFFNSKIVPNCKFPKQLSEDFNNGKLTIKEFKGKYFIVNKDATKYNDLPRYNW